MKKSITVKGITIGEGVPKICISLMGETLSELTQEAVSLSELDYWDIAEWRVDFFKDVDDINKVTFALEKIRAILPENPLIFTFRSAKEGGQKEVSKDFYKALNKAVVETGLIDIIDIELFNDENNVKILIDIAHNNNVYTIISNHDFQKTPPKEEIVSRLRKAQQMGGDLPKIAVMPTNTSDVLVLLDATYIMSELYADRPIITMSMAGKGVISRLTGEIFGSAITFGAAKRASAPGQVAVAELRNILNLLHLKL